jgi:hypothetical protein
LDSVRKSLKLMGPPNSEKSDSEPIGSEDSDPVQTQIDPPQSLATLAIAKAAETYCTKEEAEANIELIISLTQTEAWPRELMEAFDIAVHGLAEVEVPNAVAVGIWVNKQKDDPVFAVATYETQTFTVDEYKEVPTKPTRPFGALGISSMAQVRRLLGEDKEYKLEKVEKNRQVISGFQYSVPPVFRPTLIRFKPKYASLDHYALAIVCMFSRRTLTCLYSIEHLPFTAWESTVAPRAPDWRQLSSQMKDAHSINTLISLIVEETSKFISTDAQQRLSVPT